MLGRKRGVLNHHGRSSSSAASTRKKPLPTIANSSIPQQKNDFIGGGAVEFYWNRPLGAPEGLIRLSIVVHHHQGRRRSAAAFPHWGIPYRSAAALAKELRSTSCKGCVDLEVMIYHQQQNSSEDDDSLACLLDDSWESICEALARYHGRTLQSLRLQGVSSAHQLVLFRALFHKMTCCRLQQVSWILSCCDDDYFGGCFPDAALSFLCQQSHHRSIHCLQDVRILVPTESSSSSSRFYFLHHSQAQLLLQAMQCLPALRVLICQARIVLPTEQQQQQQHDVSNKLHPHYHDMVQRVESSVQLEQVELHFVSQKTAGDDDDSDGPLDASAAVSLACAAAVALDGEQDISTMSNNSTQQQEAVRPRRSCSNSSNDAAAATTTTATTATRVERSLVPTVASSNNDAQVEQREQRGLENRRAVQQPRAQSFSNNVGDDSDKQTKTASPPLSVRQLELSKERKEALEWKLQCNYFKRRCLESWAMRQRRSLRLAAMTERNNPTSRLLLPRQHNKHNHDDDDEDDVAKMIFTMEASLRILDEWRRTGSATYTTTSCD